MSGFVSNPFLYISYIYTHILLDFDRAKLAFIFSNPCFIITDSLFS